jgi:hypothetical protein
MVLIDFYRSPHWYHKQEGPFENENSQCATTIQQGIMMPKDRTRKKEEKKEGESSSAEGG